MRHLLVPACLCLMTWSSTTGPDPTLPPANVTSTATNRVLSEPPRVLGELSENIGADRALGDTYAALALPLALAPLGLLLKPIIYRSREEICDALTEAARTNDLPAPFFIRLLYQESGFRPGVISSAGALGIAQFMPETAADRGLDNPFDPLQAIPESARLLRDLSRKFGNLGLAAAAYNAGPKRVEDWLAKKGKLPQETQHYVKTITGWPAEIWTVAQTGSPPVKLPRPAPCQEAAGLLAWDGPDQIPLPSPNARAKDSANYVRTAQQPVVLVSSNDSVPDQSPTPGSETKTMPKRRLHSK
jgi:Transglycosylase SLT domain